MWDRLLTNAKLATMTAGSYSLIDDAAIAVTGRNIAFAGKMSTLSDAPENLANAVTNLNGRLVTPGLIDCHTHLVFAGNRAGEFEARLKGASYEDIAKAGGGIRSSVTATRAASEDELVALAEPRLLDLMMEGVTCVEMKSGYGLDIESERKMLRVARQLGEENAIRVKTTFLGAHALPPEYEGDADGYIQHICEKMMPQLADEGLIDAVDAFCEGIGFSPAQTRRVFEAAKSLGLPVKLHAEQLSDLGGAALAAEYGALSADHLEYLSDADINAMAASGTVAVLLPGAYYTLNETKMPPINALRKAGVPMALATDMNPGTSPMRSLLLAMNMGATIFRMTPEEALLATTANAAKALGLDGEIGTLEVGKRADIAVWNVDSPGELTYWLGGNPLAFSLFEGVPAMVADAAFDI